MAKKYNPWTGFLEDTATKASVNDAAPIVGKKYTIRGKEFKVLEVKGNNVKVLGSDGIVSHLNIKMFDEKPTIDKAIRNCDAEKIILPEIIDTWNLIDKYNIKYTKSAGGIQIDVDEAVSKGANKEYIKKLSKVSKLYGRGDF